MSIQDEQVVYIQECQTSAQMWEALRIIHEPHGNQSIISTKHALYDTIASENADVIAHLNELHLIREHLTLAGELVSKNEFKVLVASSLPKS